MAVGLERNCSYSAGGKTKGDSNQEKEKQEVY